MKIGSKISLNKPSEEYVCDSIFFFFGGGFTALSRSEIHHHIEKENFFAKCRELEVFQRRPLAEDAL